jgi:serine protease 56
LTILRFFSDSGALNTVGRYIVNMTRGKEASITNHNPSENVPDAILTLTKNVLGQNVTKTIEPMIKRIGIVETRDDPAIESSLTTIEPVRDFTVNATLISSNRDAKKKKIKTTKRKDQATTSTKLTATTKTTEKPSIHVDNRKFNLST